MNDRAYLARLFVDHRDEWDGPVERRHPASYQRPSEIMIRRCDNSSCRHWTPTRLDRCTICGSRLPPRP